MAGSISNQTIQRGASVDNMTLVFKGVPVQVCSNCGEAYVDEGVTRQILGKAEEAAASGVQVDIREFAA
jgi:YgiT-type zinc finger domain-containing protein